MKRTATVLAAVILFVGGVFGGRMVASRLTTMPLLSITVTPEGASVFVDGSFRGYAPLTLDTLAPGEHLVRLSAEGYQDARTRVDLEGETSITLDMERVPTASLTVTSNPAGAAVVINGHVRGRTPLSLNDLAPGQYSVELTATNHIPQAQALILHAGKTETLDVALKHRQVEAYRQRLAQDPGELGAYNDLGELLFVLGRYEEAAETYVEGFIQSDKHGNRDDANRYNAKKLKTVKGRRDPQNRFKPALDRAVLDAVKADKMSGMLFDYFRQIESGSFKTEYLNVYDTLARKHPENREIGQAYLRFLERAGEFDRLRRVSTQLIESSNNNAGICLAVAEVLNDACQGRLNDKRDDLLPVIDKALAAAKADKPESVQRIDLLYQIARRAQSAGQPKAYKGALAEAVKQGEDIVGKLADDHHRDTAAATKRFNEVAMALVDEYRRDDEIEKAYDLCERVADSPDHREPAVRRARAVKRQLEKQVRDLKREREKERKRKEREQKEAEKKAAQEKARQEAERKKKEAEKKEQDKAAE